VRIVVEVVVQAAEPGDRPPAGSPLRVEVRDTTYEDALAETVCGIDAAVRDEPGAALAVVELVLPRRPDVSPIWVHVDVDGDGRVSLGDYVTMASYPVPAGDGERVAVAVRRVGPASRPAPG
jgi:hypothetical protein